MYPEVDVEEEVETYGDEMIVCRDGEGFPLTTGRTRKVVLQWNCSYCDHYVFGDSDDPDDVEEWKDPA
jgi:hypothetical protein